MFILNPQGQVRLSLVLDLASSKKNAASMELSFSKLKLIKEKMSQQKLN